MNTEEIVKTFVEFFRERGHQLVSGSSLVPRAGDSVLFTSSGMHPLTPYLEGRPHPLGRRLVSLQRSLRTTDLEDVGDQWHLTVFQMLGTWSLGSYSGTQSVRWGYELVCDRYGIDPGRLYATVFRGDDQVGEDTDVRDAWGELGVPVELTLEENWWDNGPTGLCGPDSELFVWTGPEPPAGTPATDARWLELWNHVMMRYRRCDDGSLEQLAQPNIDTGMGLERLVTVLQGKRSVFECEILEPWTTTLRTLWQLGEQELRLPSDHVRSSIAIVADGIRPSNTGRGYVLRRLLRRALTALWRDDTGRSLSDLPDDLITRTLEQFGQEAEVAVVREVLRQEEGRFADLLERGRAVLSRRHSSEPPDDAELRYLHDTYGLPRELVAVLLEAPG